MTARVAVFGLGRMGAGYESIAGVPRNHLAAILGTPGLELVAAIDPSADRRAAAARAYPAITGRLYAGPDLESSRTIDLAVISTPSEVRECVASSALAAKPRLVIFEKPLAVTIDEARRLVAATTAIGAQLRVNFHRRLAPEMVALRAEARAPVRAIQARYGKGLLNYGTHLIDLLIEWCGRPDEAQALAASSGHPSDPTISFRLRFEGGAEALVLGLEGTHYDVFDVCFLQDCTMVEIRAGGAERSVWRSELDRHYAGYTHLALQADASAEGPLGGLAELYRAAAANLLDGAPMPGCDAADALTGLEVIEAIKMSATHGGVKVPLLLVFNPDLTNHRQERM